ncbi:AKAP7 2'5' RNA ligase like domain [Trypanosoma vivax]|nr:hypothetical protein TRVL_07315 [Trypanosoma vivax]KAH8608061.1 AKAP7 2'5' RNA ligase like domain [Trypanosoma vivax]
MQGHDNTKQLEVEAVRREKEFDSRTRERLQACYGPRLAASTREGEGAPSLKSLERAVSWKCAACGQLSRDARALCGFCLAVEPGVVPNRTDTDHSRTIPGRHDRAGVGDGESSCRTVVSTRMAPGRSEDPEVHVMSFQHGRAYRVFAIQPPPKPVRSSGSPAGVHSSETRCEEAEEEAMVPRVNERPHRPPRRKPYTHFISLPVGQNELARGRIASLIEQMKQRCVDPVSRVSEDIFTTAPRAHFSLLMLSLTTAEDLSCAVERMRVLQDQVRVLSHAELSGQSNCEDACAAVKCSRPSIRLGGLHVMEGNGCNEQNANVLYMGLADDASYSALRRLQDLVHSCFAAFTKDDSRAADSKLLHMTLMNTKWRGNVGENPKKKGATSVPRISFDASAILRDFKDVCIGEDPMPLDRIELCTVSYDAAQECYPCEAVVYL